MTCETPKACVKRHMALMRFVSAKAVDQQDIPALHRVRERLLRARTALVNEVHGSLGSVSVNSFLDTRGPKITRPQPKHIVAHVLPGQGLCSYAVQSAGHVPGRCR
jgi:transposase